MSWHRLVPRVGSAKLAELREQGNQMLIHMVRYVVEQPCDSQCDERFSVLVA